MTREEELNAFITQVRELARIWPDGGTMHVFPCDKGLETGIAQESGWLPPVHSGTPFSHPAKPVQPRQEQHPAAQPHQEQLF